MTPQLFHLPNWASHHVLTWLVRHGGVARDALVAKAFELAADNAAAALDLADDYELVACELGDLLRAWFEMRFPWIDRGDVGDSRPETGLLAPLVALAAREVSWPDVAEGLLRSLGKWSPEPRPAFPTSGEEIDNIDDDESELT